MTHSPSAPATAPTPFLNMTMPLTPSQRRLRAAGGLAFVVWCVAALFGPALLAQAGISLSPHGLAQIHPHGHPFVDARSWLGLPNALDVLSNVPFAFAGGWGLWALKRAERSAFPVGTREALRVFFWGLVLTSAGSSIYHWAPSAQSLVMDRLGMTVTFAGALGLAMAERVKLEAARATWLTVAVLGAVSAVMTLSHGNVLPWAVVQFGGMGFMAWATLRRPLPTALGMSLGGLLLLYALAKVFELGDAAVFHATGDLLSGHSIKHLIAALAAWPVIRAIRQNAHTSAKSAGQ